MPDRLLIAGGMIFLSCISQFAHALSVLDDSGRRVELAQPARRIVTLAPNLTELVFDLDAGERVQATVQYSNYPPAAKRIPRIGSSGSINLEALLSYRPDLVLAWRSGNNPQQLASIQRLGIPVYRSEPQHLEDIPATLVKLGHLMDRDEQAATLARNMRETIAGLRERYAHVRQLRGFYQIWDQPLYTVNGGHIISDVMQLCGIHNVFADDPVLAPVVSLESVLARDPQIIISGGSAGHAARALASWRVWTSLTAVRADNLFHIDADLMQRDTPRILQGARLLCQQAQLARRHLDAE